MVTRAQPIGDAAALRPPAQPPGRWARTARTRLAILDAARDVFLERGYADASIAEVVERSGSSVGSIYHHFGGKAELYMALWETHRAARADAARAAVQRHRAGRAADPLELFLAGARADMEFSWTRRELDRLFLHDGGPAGFDALRRGRGAEWIQQNSALLGVPDDAVARLRVVVLTSVIADAAREVCSCDSWPEARALVEASLIFLRRIAA
ncbi:MAG: TetR/AcrR family transcriptional regulator [Frankiaceae bacterium]|nr:TetR/AcrR family transcriptional regulator [Frankiaceae bacterium]